MTAREEFVKIHLTEASGKYFSDRHEMLDTRHNRVIFEAGYQAAAEHYEAERNALLAAIAQKDAALKNLITDAYNACADSSCNDAIANAEKSLSLQPDNCRLVEVARVQADEFSVEWKSASITPAGTKLYTIEVKGME